jgi:dTDP-glucose pyrophosphorylase
MYNYKKHLINHLSSIKEALSILNPLGNDAILFVTDESFKLIGSLTDGDIRRGFLRGLDLESDVISFIQPNPKKITKGNYTVDEVIQYREQGYKIVPIVDSQDHIVGVVNFRFHKSYLPIDAVVMAGGRGERLKPFTDTTPKPLLKVGSKPIIEYNIDQLAYYGISNVWVSVRYLGKQIEAYLKDGDEKGISIEYIWENEPLGTIGALSGAELGGHDYVLIINSDILTNVNLEDFFLDFIEKNAILSVVTIPYAVKIPYAIFETDQDAIISLKEKPEYNYYANGGIYLMKRSCLSLIPKGEPYNATDLIEQVIKNLDKVVYYPLRGYWLDIGKPKDFEKANEDISHISFK